MPKLIIDYCPFHGMPRRCVIGVTEKDCELSNKQLWERFIGPAEAALINVN